MKTKVDPNIIEKIRDSINDMNYNLECYNINQGGCGAFALVVYNKLLEYNIDCSVYSITNGPNKNRFDKVSNTLINQNEYTMLTLMENGCYLDHLILKVGRSYFDAKDITNKPLTLLYRDAALVDSAKYKSLKNTYLLNKIEISHLETLVNSSDGWNPRFNRSYIDEVTSLINNVFDITFNNN